MTSRLITMTPEHLEKIGKVHRGEIALPAYITDWVASVEEKQAIFGALMQDPTQPPELVQRVRDAVVKMMRRKDYLYAKLLEDTTHKTWDDLRAERPPTAEDLFDYTVKDTEDFLNGPGAAAFALYLDQHWRGFLKDLAHACLRDCDPLLEEWLTLTPEIRRLLAYPKEVFGTSSIEILEQRYLEWLASLDLEKAPSYVVRLLEANVNVALNNEFSAFVDMGFARCEAAVPNFPELMGSDDNEANVYLWQSERWIIEKMLELWPTT